MTIAEFLTLRFDEIQADAELAQEGYGKTGVWTRDGGSIYDGHPADDVVDWVYDEAWAHIARHDPAYVLVDIAAKRRILARHGGRHLCEDGMAGERWDDDTGELVDWPCDDARALAAPLAAHEAYNPRWALDADEDRWSVSE